MLDSRSTAWLEQHIGSVSDPFLRAMLWGALWDLVRDARLAPSAFIATALRQLPSETDEQIAPSIVGRMTAATDRYLSVAQRDSVIGSVESLLLAGAGDSARPYGIRKTELDAYIGIARTPTAIARLRAWLDSGSTAGLALRQPTRWSIVTTLTARGAADASSLIASEAARDTVNGPRRAFIAGAARPDSGVKAAYFARYFNDRALNEDWVTASLGAFNNPDQSALTLPYLHVALDSLPWIQQNRRIFFLGSWLGSFVGGQKSAEALAQIDAFLAEHPTLPLDLREKILQTRDDLERTVRIRKAFAG